jgi:hypothetical protein
MLDGKRSDDSAVTRCGVGLRARFMAGEENFADTAVFEVRDGRTVMEPVNLEVKRLGCPSVWQALAHGNGSSYPLPFFSRQRGCATPLASTRTSLAVAPALWGLGLPGRLRHLSKKAPWNLIDPGNSTKAMLVVAAAVRREG